MNRPRVPLWAVAFLVVMSGLYLATFAKFCHAWCSDECTVVYFAARKRHCQHCGGRLVYWYDLWIEVAKNR